MNTRLARIAVFVLVIVALAIVPFVGAQEGPNITVNLTPYEGNPILTVGEEGAWDARGVADPRVIYADGLFHMFYIGWIEGSMGNFMAAVGYATSEDGLTWTKYEANPVFALDTTSAGAGVLNAAVMLDGETWVMLFTPSKDAWTPAETVMRATAPSPTGPWTVDTEPVLTLGDTRGGRRNGIAVDSFLRTDEGYVLFYQTMNYATWGPAYVGDDIGRADSPDGLQWTEYNDPATTDRGLTERDPVFVENPLRAAWDGTDLGEPVVQWSEDGWEMFYYGAGGYWKMGYATSEDGIIWTRYGDAPILAASSYLTPGSILMIDNTYYLYYTDCPGSTHICQLAVTTVTITRE